MSNASSSPAIGFPNVFGHKEVTYYDYHFEQNFPIFKVVCLLVTDSKYDENFNT